LGSSGPEEIPATLAIAKILPKPDYLHTLFLTLGTAFKLTVEQPGQAAVVYNTPGSTGFFSWAHLPLASVCVPTVLSIFETLKQSSTWKHAIDTTARTCLLGLKNLSGRNIDQVHTSARSWLAIGVLAYFSSVQETKFEASIAQLCDNHDDGVTEAAVRCSDCASDLCYLCSECDGVVHMPRSLRGHTRASVLSADSPALSLNTNETVTLAELRDISVWLDRLNLSVRISVKV